MNQSGKILLKNIKTLVGGRSSKLGGTLTKHLAKYKPTLYTVDRRTPSDLTPVEKFTQGDLADETFVKSYLRQLGPVDAFVNCAAVRKSYNYYLSYLLSKSLLDTMRENEVNEFGCRGCIINLVHLSGQYDEQYFTDQDEFANRHNIDSSKIDDEVYALADRLTAARIRCNTILVNEKSDPAIFSNLVKHIIEDQYVAGQILNMEDDLKHDEPDIEKVLEDQLYYPKPKAVEEKYTPPKEIANGQSAPLSLPKIK